MKNRFDLVVIGGGEAGIEAGLRGLELGALAEDFKDMVFNHPPISEGIKKAAKEALITIETS